MAQEIDSDDGDWFTKDEDEMLQALHNQKQAAEQSITEYITGPTANDEYIIQHRLAAAADPAANSVNSKKDGATKLATADLRKMMLMTPLDIFLHAITSDAHFFRGQVYANDSQERVLLYTRVLAIIVSLELPYFQRDMLEDFAANDTLLAHFHALTAKLFSKRYKALWTDEQRIDQVVSDIQILLLQTHQLGLLTPACMDLMRQIRRFITMSDSPTVAKRGVCVEFAKQLERIMHEDAEEQQPDQSHTKHVDEIYPTLDELLETTSGDDDAVDVDVQELQQSVKDMHHDNTNMAYIQRQKKLLREDFLIPLRACVREIKRTGTLKLKTSRQVLFVSDVQIVLNEEFLNAYRNEMLFVDVLGSRRQQGVVIDSQNDTSNTTVKQSKFKELKTGTLLCFSTSNEFDNLILATVTYTDMELLHAGYIGIEIQRQYNVGNIYGKQLLMFEAPAFFEPYNHVYDYLSARDIGELPMQRYIVSGETERASPAYLKADTTYSYEDSKFQPLADKTPPQTLPLNKSQAAAYMQALSQDFCLVQGPPGTGKTYLSTLLMKTLIENAPNKPIVLITYTNESLDKCLLKLAAHTDSIVRFGSQTRQPEIAKYSVRDAGVDKTLVNPELKRLYYLTNLQFREQFQQLQTVQQEFDGTDESYQRILKAQHVVRSIAGKLSCIRILFQYYVVREKHVIAMTTTCAAKTNFLFRLLKSSIVIFEEAAEILESHVLACLTPHVQHIIMIGDHFQLKPYTSSYEHGRASALHISLFERLINQQLQPAVLQLQYRMRPAIAELICPLIYEKLENADVVKSYAPIRGMRANLYFVTHEHTEAKADSESSLYNKYEIDQIIALAKYLTKEAEYMSTDIVILSPYAKQIQIIKNQHIRDGHLRELRATTVDSFQGLEANIVLLSLVRSNSNGNIGFLSEMNRICVALSRAKHALYIIGNLNLLAACSSSWRAIEFKLAGQDAIGSDFPYDPDED